GPWTARGGRSAPAPSPSRKAGPSRSNGYTVVPAKAGTHLSAGSGADRWIPACAGMTTHRPLIHDGDKLDLDHRPGLREAADLHRGAGGAGDADIAHAHIAVLRELLVIGDEGVGLDHIGPARAGLLQACFQVLEGLLHLRPHVADDVSLGISAQLTGDIDRLARPGHGHDIRVGGPALLHSHSHASRVAALDLRHRHPPSMGFPGAMP